MSKTTSAADSEASKDGFIFGQSCRTSGETSVARCNDRNVRFTAIVVSSQQPIDVCVCIVPYFGPSYMRFSKRQAQ